ncbi:MAG TPA: helix-turn-helix domain-containing protein, partial [Planctomycetaceae bacterium]|nr:helix-turn-helix domain-containing protein [Planctomycetaceae bacterium]
MATKYITLEEAAAQLGITPDRLIRLREQGEIRGFADRGTWKFRPQDVDQLREKLAAGESPGGEPDLDKTGLEMSGASVLEQDVAESGDQEPTALQSPEAAVVPVSDSDVRLDADEAGDTDRPDSDPEVQLTVESDSDVRLAGAADGEP